MTSALANAFNDADSRRRSSRELSRSTIFKAYGSSGDGGSSGNPYAAATGGGNVGGLLNGDRNLRQAAAQYSAAHRDYSYTAIRPVAVKIADQEIHVGTKDQAKQKPDGKIRTKSSSGSSGSPFSLRRKSLTEGIDILDDHPLLEALEDPNPYMVQWSLLYCTAFSMEATGRAFWWLEGDGQSRPLRLWYMPATWVTPVHTETTPFASWNVRPPNSTKPFPVASEDMIPFSYPDAADPTSSRSPLQTQARAVNTDELIQDAQHSSMKNSMNPGMVIGVGKLPAPPTGGEAMRPALTAEQRKQLIEAVRLVYSGVQRHGDPIIVDGLIESVTPYRPNPTDLDFPNGSKLTKDRIMQGIGTNPIIAGQVEGANRATAYVAEDIFYANKVNPLITLMSQTLTKYLRPRFAASVPAGKKLYVWIEKAKPHDAVLKVKELQMLVSAGVLKKDQLLEAFDMPPMDDGGDELIAPKMPPGIGAGGVGTANGGGKMQPPAGQAKPNRDTNDPRGQSGGGKNSGKKRRKSR